MGVDNPPEVVVILVTVPGIEVGTALARSVVESRLATCGNVIPGLTSVYRWNGRVEADSEALILFKTSKAMVWALKEEVVKLHPYEVPEFLVLPVASGHLPYLEWVARETIDPDQT
jgi:periplasmic divalent cation tolerance protein